MKAYKGFNKDMTCRGFQYEEGKTYETEKANVCECGFHACENPLDCMKYYRPNESVYHEVEMDGEIDGGGNDSKIASTKITIGAKLSIAGMVKGAIDFVMNKVKATTGDEAHAEVQHCEAIAVVCGRNCKAKGGDGSWLVLTERDSEHHILGVQAIKIDGKKYKPDTWYTLENGNVMEVDQ